MITKYDRLVGNGSDYVVLPIVYKAGWSYKYSVNVIDDLINNNTQGVLAQGGIYIMHGSYRELAIKGIGADIWSSFKELETLEISPSGVFKNGTSISGASLSEDATENIILFLRWYNTPTMGDFVHFRSLEVWDTDGILIHKYVPCMIGDAVGLFDDVLHTFVPSANNTLSVENDV